MSTTPLAMPMNVEVRAAWHIEHRAACGCRPIPARLAEQMRERGLLSR